LYPQYGSSSSSSSDSSPSNGVSIRCNDENGYARNVGEYWVSKFGEFGHLRGKGMRGFGSKDTGFMKGIKIWTIIQVENHRFNKTCRPNGAVEVANCVSKDGYRIPLNVCFGKIPG
jgi:hypothetical protein